MSELVAPVGSAEGISAAVQSGADAVCVSFGGTPAASGYDITEDEFARGCRFCRARGVKVYAIIERVPFDDDFASAVETGRRASRMGADGIIVNDMGLIWALRQATPELPVHAGSKLGIHNLYGVRLAAAMGATRVALSPDLERRDIGDICAKSPVEIEVAVHGPVCPSIPGQCLLPAFNGDIGMWRDVCPEFCRDYFPCESSRKCAPFDRADLCLADYVGVLRDMGVAALSIIGRHRRPEYVAAVTGVYAKLMSTGAHPSEEDYSVLLAANPVSGLSTGRFDGSDQEIKISAPNQNSDAFYETVRRDYLSHEFQRVNIRFAGIVTRGEPFKLAVSDDRGFTLFAEGAVPELAFHQEADSAYLLTELSKTGGTPFTCTDVRFNIEKGLFLHPRQIAPVRDKLLAELLEKRAEFEIRGEGDLNMPPREPNSPEPPVLTISLLRCSQLSKRLLELAPPVVYLPLNEVVSGNAELEPFLESEDISVCPALPAFIRDSEMGAVMEKLLRARELGVREVLVGNIGHIVPLKKLGFEVRGDYSLNIRNSVSLYAMSAFYLKSVTLPPDMSAPRARAISKNLPVELIVYGRVPLMPTGDCVIRTVTGACSCDGFTGIADRSGFVFPVTHDGLCRTTVWSSRKTFLAKRSQEYMSSGLWGVRLVFTTEDEDECATVAARYLELNDYEPVAYDTGLF